MLPLADLFDSALGTGANIVDSTRTISRSLHFTSNTLLLGSMAARITRPIFASPAIGAIFTKAQT